MKQALATLLAGILAAGIASAAERQTQVEISGLTCPSCPYIAADAISSIKSVEIINGDYDQAAQKIVFDVIYDDTATTPQIIAAAPEEYGYPGRVLVPTDSGS